MKIIDCIDKFLNANGFEWFEKNIYDVSEGGVERFPNTIENKIKNFAKKKFGYVRKFNKIYVEKPG